MFFFVFIKFDKMGKIASYQTSYRYGICYLFLFSRCFKCLGVLIFVAVRFFFLPISPDLIRMDVPLFYACHFFPPSSLSLSLSRPIPNIVGVFLLEDFFCSRAGKTKQNEKLHGIFDAANSPLKQRLAVKIANGRRKKIITTQFVTETF